jgi:hypothetical protein
VVTRCYKCSRFNHKAGACRREETCPLCMGCHNIKACTTPKGDYKCVNCMNFNKQNEGAKVHDDHSSMDKTCPSLQAAIQKHRLNTEYRVSEKDWNLVIIFFSRCPVCGKWCKVHWLLLDTPSCDWNTRR